MKRLLIKFLKFSLWVIGIPLFIIVVYGTYNRVTAIPKKRSVRDLCAIAKGTDSNKILPRAKELGFVKSTDSSTIMFVYNGKAGFESNVSQYDDKLIKFTDGKVVAGKVILFPFGRMLCTINFADKKVTSTRISYLD